MQIAGRRKVLQAHRVALALANNAVIPEGVLVRHTCPKNRLCCAPHHLRLGDYCGNDVPPEEAV